MSNPKSEVYAELYEAAIKATVEVAGKVPEANRMRQLQENKAHPLWLLGHLAWGMDQVTNVWVLNGEATCPEDYVGKFAPDLAGGAPITTDAGDYPAWDDVLENYQKAGAAVVEAIRALDDSELDGELKGPIPDPVRGFFGNLGQSVSSMGTHDAHHRGQMAMIGGLS
ncbi:MAG: DinB family protein [Candidatus Hydrogenedentes bacterium]|nr:DinB family protein [Candidatus Hydrogenedentota bacterium]